MKSLIKITFNEFNQLFKINMACTLLNTSDFNAINYIKKNFSIVYTL